MASKLDLAETDKEREDAAFHLILDVLEKDRAERRKTRRICVICSAMCVVALLLFGGLFAVLAAGVQINTTTKTEETHVTQETSGEGDAVYQAGDDAKFYAEGGGE